MVASFGTASTNASACLDRTFDVVLVGVRIPEIGQHAVDSVVGDIAIVTFDYIFTTAVTCGRHLAQIFKIKPAPDHRQTNHFASHDRELPALGRRCNRAAYVWFRRTCRGENSWVWWPIGWDFMPL